MAVTREEITREWLDCLAGNIDREGAAHWAQGRAWMSPPSAIAEEIGLQCLYRVNSWIGHPDGSREVFYGVADERFRREFEEWQETCELLDREPQGTVWIAENLEYSDPIDHLSTWTGRFTASWQGAAPLCLESPEGHADR